MTSNRRQHFVPQFFFRNFGREREIALFNIKAGRHVADASIRGQCQRDWLYGRDGTIEKALNEIEGWGAGAIRSILERRCPPEVGSREHVGLLVFVVSQWARTPAAAIHMEAYATSFARSVVKFDPSTPEHLREAIDNVEARCTAPEVESLRSMIVMWPLIADLSMCLLTSDSSTEFVFCDAPVVIYNHWTRADAKRVRSGLASSGVMLFVPLDPSNCLLFFDATTYKLNGPSAAIAGVRGVNEADVAGANALQMLEAGGNIFHSGSAMAKRQVDGLPWSHRGRFSPGVDSRSFLSPTGTTIVGTFSRNHDFRLRPSYLRVRTARTAVPVADRWTWSREEASQLADLIEEERGPVRPEALTKSGRVRVRSLRKDDVNFHELRPINRGGGQP